MRFLLAAALICVELPCVEAQERAALRVCMAEGNAPLSDRASKEPRGLDVAVAQAIASEMGRALSVVFFESQYERETTLAQEVNALLPPASVSSPRDMRFSPRTSACPAARKPERRITWARSRGASGRSSTSASWRPRALTTRRRWGW